MKKYFNNQMLISKPSGGVIQKQSKHPMSADEN